MNSCQKFALLTAAEAITEESFKTGLTVGHGTSVQPFAIKPLPASSQLDASKHWSKSCEASLVWGFFSAELTVTARLPGRGWLAFSWLQVKGQRAQLRLSSRFSCSALHICASQCRLSKDTPESNTLRTQPEAEKVTQIQPLPQQEGYDQLVAMPRACVKSIIARVC